MTNNTDSPQAAAPYMSSLLRRRWSPRDYADRPVEQEKLFSLFQAARWAASCFNEQPWRFVTATKADSASFARVLSLLVERNQQWAKGAYLIGFTAGKKTFTHNSAPNRFGFYDVGAAGACLAVEATALGLQAHFMGGFDAARARSEFGVPEDFEVGAAFAVGYPVEHAGPPERSRKPLAEVAFGAEWGKPAEFTAEPAASATDVEWLERGLNDMILAGDFDGAYAKYYAEDAVLQENSDEPRVGLAVNRAREAKFLESVAEVHPTKLVSSVVEGERSCSEWVYDFTFRNGTRLQLSEVAVRQWKDGLVSRERFYLNRQT
jgi:nitroreductase